jgi:hypothetical protein
MTIVCAISIYLLARSMKIGGSMAIARLALALALEVLPVAMAWEAVGWHGRLLALDLVLM